MKHIIVGLGEVLWDMLPEGKKLGGAPANFAYHVAQFGLDSMAVSAIGNDKLGDETLEAFDEKRLKYNMQRIPYPTGTVQVTLDKEGVPCYDIKKEVAWDNIQFTSELEEMAKNCRAVCFGSLAQRHAVSRGTIGRFLDAMPKKNDVLKIFDINLRQKFYTKDILVESFQKCNILKINDEELIIIGKLFGHLELEPEERCRLLLETYHLKMLILTCGVNGSYVFTAETVSFLPTPKVNVADTVGAGDSFTGAFCASIIKGMTVEEAHKLAVNVSAYVCTQNGAMPDIRYLFSRESNDSNACLIEEIHGQSYDKQGEDI